MAKNKYDSLFDYPVGDVRNYSSIVKQATAKIGKKSKKSYTDLQDYLQGIFYPDTVENPTNTQTKIHKKIQEAAEEMLTEQLKKEIKKYEFDSNKAVSSINNENQVIPIKNYESFSHTKYIEVSTLQRRLEAAKKALAEVNINDFENSNYNNLVKELNHIIEICNQLINNNELYSTILKKKLNSEEKEEIPVINLEKNGDQIFKLVKSLDEKYLLVSYLYDMPIPNYMLGEVFEKSLEMAFSLIDIEAMTDDLVTKKMEEIMKSKTAGAQSGSRGQLTVGIKGYEIIDAKKRKNDSGFNYIIKSPTSNRTFTIKGAFDDKQQKMDVQLDFGNDVNYKSLQGKSFKASAKNWTTLSGHNFGETDLQGAILRTSTLTDAIAFGLQLGNKGYKEQKGESINVTYENQLNHFARINLLLDIVMGYSQESGYVNTLIINDREFKRIRVYAIRDILDSLKDEIELLALSSNYNDDKVKKILYKSGIDWTNRLNIQEYENKLLTALKSMKFNINTKILPSDQNLT